MGLGARHRIFRRRLHWRQHRRRSRRPARSFRHGSGNAGNSALHRIDQGRAQIHVGGARGGPRQAGARHQTGRHAQGAKAAATHTGALAGSDAVYEAAFRRAGLLRVLDLDEFSPPPRRSVTARRWSGKRLAILTNGGGVGVLAVDRLADFGGELATLSPETLKNLDAALPPIWSRANPIDIAGDADEERYAVALDQLLDDPANDAILVMNVPTALASPDRCRQVGHRRNRAASQKAHTGKAGLRGLGRRQRIRHRSLRCCADSELRHRIGCGRRLHASRALSGIARLADGDAASLPEGFAPDTAAVRPVIDVALREKRNGWSRSR